MSKIGSLIVGATASGSTFAERHAAFGELVSLFQDMAYAQAYAVLGDFHLAEDAAQEAFITAWRKLAQLREPEAFPGWLRRIVQTECNRLTRGKRLPLVPLDTEREVAAAGTDLQSAIEAHDLKQAVLSAVNALPPGEREAVTLFYVGEQSHREMSAFLEVPTTTVAKRLHSARARLRGMLMKKFKDEFEDRRPSRNPTFAEKVRRGIFDIYVGQYRYEQRPELVVNVRREGGTLLSEAAGQINELFAEGDSESELFVKDFDGRGEFIRDEQGRVTHFIYFEFGREMGRAKKIS